MSTGTNKERIEQNNLKLEDIKTQIQNLPEAGSSGGIKQFATIEEMQADTTAQEGDLAVVYRNEVQNATADSRFQTATFPQTVILDTAITSSVEVRYSAVDSSKMFDCMGSLDSSSFRMECYTESNNIRIQYTSSDGITYTRTDEVGNPVDFGTEIYYEMPEMWNDAIGKFIQVGGSTFEGLYQYGQSKSSNQIIYITNLAEAGDTITYEQKMLNLPIEALNSYAKSGSTGGSQNFILTSTELIVYPHSSMIYTENGKFYMCSKSNNSSFLYYTVNLNTMKCTNSSSSPVATLSNGKTAMFEITTDMIFFIGSSPFAPGSIEFYNGAKYEYRYKYGYINAPNQLTADTSYVYEKEFYGKNGIENGTLTQNVSNTFTDVNAELYGKIQTQYDNLVPRVLTDADRTIDTNIYCIPIRSDGTVLLNTSGVTSMYYMFTNFPNLITVPLLDTSKVTDMRNMFYSCPNLITISKFDTSKVTNMNEMFGNCPSLTTIPLLNTSKVTNMKSMFWCCSKLTTVPLLDTSNVTDMTSMFQECTSLTEIPLLDTSKVTNMGQMFYKCANLVSIPQLDTSNVTSMTYMFYGCSKLTTIPLLNTGKVTTMSYMFIHCSSLTSIPLLNTTKVNSMYVMFKNCTNLTTIPLLDTSSVTNMQDMCTNCPSLSDESLNNILAMCKNASKITSNKTLKYIGLTSEQSNKCKTLSNYSSFTSAGWTTGY